MHVQPVQGHQPGDARLAATWREGQAQPQLTPLSTHDVCIGRWGVRMRSSDGEFGWGVRMGRFEWGSDGVRIHPNRWVFV